MIIVLLIGLLLIMGIWQTIYALGWKKNLSVEISFKQPYVYAGEQAELTEVVENRKWLPVSPVEVRFRTKKGLSYQEMENTSVSDFVYKRDIFALLGKQRITRKLVVDCEKRGCYQVEDVSMETFSLLQEKKYKLPQKTEAQLYVYAKRTDVSAILKVIESLLGERESNRKYLEDPFLFSSIRGYTMHDPMKMINWKASAKTGELMVNTYASPQNERMMIYLDIEDRGILKKEHLKEDSISVAATLYQKLLSKGTEVGICINLCDKEQGGAIYLPPARQKSQRALLEQTLAGSWSEEKVLPFEKMFAYPFGDAIPVIISKNFSEKKKQFVEDFMGQGTKGIWILPCEKGECPKVESDHFLFVKREVER